jgi:hypothetical protein
MTRLTGQSSTELYSSLLISYTAIYLLIFHGIMASPYKMKDQNPQDAIATYASVISHNTSKLTRWMGIEHTSQIVH